MRSMQILILIFLALSLIGCTTPLQETVRRDMILLDDHAHTRELLDYLGNYDVVVIGEYHGVLEHREFVTDLMIALSDAHGFRHFQTETPHAFQWMLQAYTDKTIETMLPLLMHAMQVNFNRIREHNGAVGPEEMIHVYGIDTNHNPFFIIVSLEFMLEQKLFEHTDLLHSFLAAAGDLTYPEDEQAFSILVSGLLETIISDDDHLRSLWGDRWYREIHDLLYWELVSIEVRKPMISNDIHLRTRLREEVIKSFSDMYLADAAHGTLINVGGNHAQKQHFRGTPMEWLAEYLMNRSLYAGGSTCSVFVIPAKGTIEWGGMGNYTEIDITRRASRHELFNTLYRASGGSMVFLPLTDELFSQQHILMNFHFETRTILPYASYDAVILLPEVQPSR